MHEVGVEHDLHIGGATRPLARFRAAYGAGPLHLLVLIASFAIAGAAVAGWFERPRDVGTVLVWFGAAIVVHDLILLPLYSLLDRIAVAGLHMRADHRLGPSPSCRVNPTPYLRIPAILSGLLLAVFFPVILGLGAQTELSASGIAESGYLPRWLLATGVMFTLSGAAYVVAVARDYARPGSGHPKSDPVATGQGPGAPDASPVRPACDTAPDSNRAVQDRAETAPEPDQPEPSETAPGDAPTTSPTPN